MDTGKTHDLDVETLRAANISLDTLLATDFLNHYNEVAMLIDFLGSDDEISEEVLSWKPENYVDHFRHSGFRDKELAIEAYCQADSGIISRFEKACHALDLKIIDIQQAVMKSDFDTATEIGKTLFDHIGQINGIIIGDAPGTPENDPDHDHAISQSDIDSLFS